jgi:NADPH:quinone reductase-like Zn-dependent oxidoreductase
VADMTALRALREGGTILGRNVLVTGGVGQLARAAGATVTALVTSTAREAKARELGARHVVTNLDDPGLGPFHRRLHQPGPRRDQGRGPRHPRRANRRRSPVPPHRPHPELGEDR